jgi:hypothetical protein
MEVKEIITYFINDATQTMDVSFRCLKDSYDEIRQDQIEVKEVWDMAYDYILNQDPMFEDEEEDGDGYYFQFHNVFDDNLMYEVISFLNEYYMVYPERIPKVEFF